LDSIEPEEALRGEMIILHGCGWIPLESIELQFQTPNGRKTVQASYKTLDTIEAKVPLDAISGLVYVKTTNKHISQWLEIKEFSLSGTSKDKIVDATQFALQGSELSTTEHIYFRDSKGNLLEGQMSNITNTGIWVTAPSGLEIGEVAVYVVLDGGEKSNELTLKKVPLTPEASPSYSVIGNGLSITITQEEGAQIYYMLADNTTVNEHLYTAPITLTTQEMKYTQQFLYAFARVEIDGISYDSSTASYIYDPCPEGEELDEYRECVVVENSTSQNGNWITPAKSVCESNGGAYDTDGNIPYCYANWNNAKTICATSGGSLPTIAQLLSVHKQCDTDNDGNAEISCLQTAGFAHGRTWWTSEEHPDTYSGSHAWSVNLYYGFESATNQFFNLAIECVR